MLKVSGGITRDVDKSLNLFDQLSIEDKEKITNYILTTAKNEDNNKITNIDLPWILRFWSSNKRNFYDLMGNNFIIKKKISVKENPECLYDTMTRLCSDNLSPIGRFISKFYTRLTYANFLEDLDIDSRAAVLMLTSPMSLTENKPASFPYDKSRIIIDFHDEDIKPLVIYPNSKVIKIIGKLSKILGVDGFEDFRNAHSMVFNTSELTGDLCLSIHPLDFMTMSDNSYGWHSCMSWLREGEYRQGTVEMMNSSCVIEAYLEGSIPMRLDNNSFWNGKRWRQLFVVNDAFIAAIKSYPYQSATLTEQSLSWIRSLFTNSNGENPYSETLMKYDPYTERIEGTHINISFDTGYMYNDFGAIERHKIYLNKSLLNNDDEENRETMYCYYSGENECMACGSEISSYFDVDSFAQNLFCEECGTYDTCSCCGCILHSSEDAYYDANGNPYCESCYNDHSVIDILTGDYYFDEDMEEMYLISHETKDKISNFEKQKLISFYYNPDFDIDYRWEPLLKEGINVSDAIKEIEVQNSGWSYPILGICIEDLNLNALLDGYLIKSNRQFTDYYAEITGFDNIDYMPDKNDSEFQRKVFFNNDYYY